MFETIELDQEKNTRAKIKVVGVGGAGGNAVNRMVTSGFTGVEFISVNTDAMALENSGANMKIPLGANLTKGLGAGAKPEVGHDAILESRDEVKSALEGADMVFITAGMGGGTGTGAAPIVAEICRELGILSVAVVTRPFLFEGPVRTKNSLRGLDALTSNVDTIITIHNQKILAIADNNMSMKDAFASADDVLIGAVRGISEIILKHGEIQVDFADVKTIMTSGGDALMGTGTAEGENRAVVAAQRAIHSPLLDDIQIQGASGILVNITGGEDMGILEINEAMSYIYNEVGEDNVPNIIFGTVINPDLSDEIQVTVIATGFRQNEKNEYVPQTGITGDDYQTQNYTEPTVQTYSEPSLEESSIESIQPTSPGYLSYHSHESHQVPPSSNSDRGSFYQESTYVEPNVVPQSPTNYNQPSATLTQTITQEAQVAEMKEQGIIKTGVEEVNISQTLASKIEKDELELENQMAPSALIQEEMIVEDIITEETLTEEIIEEPIAIQSPFSPIVKTAIIEDETVWNPEVDQVKNPTPDSVPAYLRQENQASQISDMKETPKEQQKIQPIQSEVKPSQAENFGFSNDIDDDFETPAFLRSQDF